MVDSITTFPRGIVLSTVFVALAVLAATLAQMGRLSRFEKYRYVGARDTMKVYDCDDEDQFAVLEARVLGEGLLEANLLQVFGPDTLPEARNRGFRLS